MALFFIYAACFGIELTINGTAALYFFDYFDSVDIATAGTIAGLFGLMNIFARSTGGIISDKVNMSRGLRGRVLFLFVVLFIEGIALAAFSRIDVLMYAIPMLIVFSLFVQMSEGATYAIVPYINKKALGSISGIVGAGGNFGAVMAGFLFRQENLAWNDAYLILGGLVTMSAFLAFAVRFSEAEETSAREEMERRLAESATAA